MSLPSLTTDRLVLRVPVAEDLGAFVAYSVSERTRFVGGARSLFTATEKFAAMIGHWHMRGFGRFAIVERASNLAIGHVGPCNFMSDPLPELSWALWDAASEGRGLATEAAVAARHWMHDALGMTAAHTAIHCDNLASIAIATTLGGQRTGEQSAHLADAQIWQFDLTSPIQSNPIQSSSLRGVLN